MRATDLPTSLAHQVRDGFYIVVGLGVIGAQNAWAMRDRLDAISRPAVDTSPVSSTVEALGERLEAVTNDLDQRLAAIESRVDAVLDQLTDGLPDAAGDLLTTTRGAAKEARAHLRTLAGRAA